MLTLLAAYGAVRFKQVGEIDSSTAQDSADWDGQAASEWGQRRTSFCACGSTDQSFGYVESCFTNGFTGCGQRLAQDVTCGLNLAGIASCDTSAILLNSLRTGQAHVTCSRTYVGNKLASATRHIRQQALALEVTLQTLLYLRSSDRQEAFGQLLVVGIQQRGVCAAFVQVQLERLAPTVDVVGLRVVAYNGLTGWLCHLQTSSHLLGAGLHLAE